MTGTGEASTAWKGSLFEGSGQVTLATSGAGTFDVNWKARSEGSSSVTTPEELLAAAHSACFSMALSHALTQNGTPPDSVDATASVTFKPGTGTSGSPLHARAVVPGPHPEPCQRIPPHHQALLPRSHAPAGIDSPPHPT